MRLKKVTNKRAFTLIEIMVTMAMATIVIFSTGALLLESQRGWSVMYNRVYGGVVDDAYVARKTFDAVVRKSSIKCERLGDNEVELYYYADPDTSILLDRYARFYVTGENEFLVDYGELDAVGNPQEPTSTITLAHNVTAASFSVAGTCMQMTLKLDDGSESLTVMSSPVRHNE